MLTTMKYLLVAILLSISPYLAYSAVDLQWGGSMLRNSDESTELTGDFADSSIGFFVQLIFVGADDQINPITNSTDGVTGTNTVVDWTFIGNGSTIFNGPDGDVAVNETYDSGSNFELNVNDKVFMRVWNAASPDFATGTIPFATATHYGDSAILTIDTTPGTTNFGSFSTTLAVIPEPSTFMSVLIAGGTVLFAMRRRFRK